MSTPFSSDKPVRMKDIAIDLGLSAVTVSKVLRGHNDISEETRSRVLARIAEMNYRPNLAARSLATGRSFTVGFVTPDMVHPFFAELAKYLASVLRSKGYYLLMSSSDEDPAAELEQIEHLLDRRVDAIILASSQPQGAPLQAMARRGIPMILVDRKFPDLQAHFVGTDDELAGSMVTGHLIQQGCRKIAYIGSPSASSSLGRLVGYREALQKAGLPVRPEHILTRPHVDNSGEEAGYEAMKALLAADPKIDGVFCQNDPTAMGAMMAILEAGLRIPGDVAVVGCGNLRYANFLRVPLTSIDQNCQRIGEKTAKLALRLLASPKGKRTTILCEPRLIVRESSLHLPRS